MFYSQCPRRPGSLSHRRLTSRGQRTVHAITRGAAHRTVPPQHGDTLDDARRAPRSRCHTTSYIECISTGLATANATVSPNTSYAPASPRARFPIRSEPPRVPSCHAAMAPTSCMNSAQLGVASAGGFEVNQVSVAARRSCRRKTMAKLMPAGRAW